MTFHYATTTIQILSIAAMVLASLGCSPGYDASPPSGPIGFDEGGVWFLSGTLTIAGDDINTDDLWIDVDDDVWGPCQAPVEELIPIEPNQDPVEPYVFWSAVVEDCALPNITFGLGPSHDEIVAAAAIEGVPTSHLRGLYANASSGLWIGGYAGTDEHLRGEGLQPDEAPLPDGIYRTEWLYGIPY